MPFETFMRPSRKRYGEHGERSRVTCRFHRTVLLLFAILGSGCPAENRIPEISEPVPPNRVNSTLQKDIEAFCGACHRVPLPSSFPKRNWHEEVQRGIDFFFESEKKGLIPPPQAAIVEYYRRLAPEEFTYPAMNLAEVSGNRIFQAESFPLPPSRPEQGPYASISFVDGDGQGLWFSDMARGIVWKATLEGEVEFRLDGVSHHPVAVRACDLNRNGETDLVITDLGSYLPEDHQKGGVVWVPDYQSGSAEPQHVLEHVGRVSDIRVLDIDEDGDQDLLVAEFGWHKTGGIHLLVNDSSSGMPRFEARKLDDRSGPIHLPVADINQDGRLDFLALISQEHEVVVAFLNQADGFQKVTLYEAPDPSYGSSGLELVDMDGDGDLDLIYSNGDTFDSKLVKPYHGISWLENTGDLKFTEHRLEALPGVHRVLPADLDGDGDFDLVAATLLPRTTVEQREPGFFHSLVWLEQISPGTFVTHSLSRDTPIHAALLVKDLNGDGFPEIIAGHFYDSAGIDQSAATVWWNKPRPGT
jgi:hypothetical protein